MAHMWGALTRNGRTPARSFMDPRTEPVGEYECPRNGSLACFLLILLKWFMDRDTSYFQLFLWFSGDESVCTKVESVLWVGQNIILDRARKGKVNLTEIGQMKNALRVGKT